MWDRATWPMPPLRPRRPLAAVKEILLYVAFHFSFFLFPFSFFLFPFLFFIFIFLFDFPFPLLLVVVLRR